MLANHTVQMSFSGRQLRLGFGAPDLKVGGSPEQRPPAAANFSKDGVMNG